MTRLLDLIDRLRRPPMTVLWGGRPGIDYQLGSPADLRNAAHLAYRARLERESRERIERMSAAIRAALPAMRAVNVKLGVSVAKAVRDLKRFAEALERNGITVADLERRHARNRRSPLTGAELDEVERLAALSRAAARVKADADLRRALRGPR